VEALRREPEELPLADLAASFEQIVADVLVERSLRCCSELALEHLVMVGGVAANHRLRSQMRAAGKTKGVSVHIAPLAYCTDNAAMVAVAALRRLSSGVEPSSLELGVAARWPLEQALSLYGPSPPF
jgi:N6-L-threonylcarbamoyladenine synthase